MLPYETKATQEGCVARHDINTGQSGYLYKADLFVTTDVHNHDIFIIDDHV